MEKQIMEAISLQMHKYSISNFKIFIENISHQHASHFKNDQTNGNSHFIVNVKSAQLFAKKPLERHRILNEATQPLMQIIHAISFQVES